MTTKTVLLKPHKDCKVPINFEYSCEKIYVLLRKSSSTNKFCQVIINKKIEDVPLELIKTFNPTLSFTFARELTANTEAYIDFPGEGGEYKSPLFKPKLTRADNFITPTKYEAGRRRSEFRYIFDPKKRYLIKGTLNVPSEWFQIKNSILVHGLNQRENYVVYEVDPELYYLLENVKNIKDYFG